MSDLGFCKLKPFHFHYGALPVVNSVAWEQASPAVRSIKNQRTTLAARAATVKLADLLTGKPAGTAAGLETNWK